MIQVIQLKVNTIHIPESTAWSAKVRTKPACSPLLLCTLLFGGGGGDTIGGGAKCPSGEDGFNRRQSIETNNRVYWEERVKVSGCKQVHPRALWQSVGWWWWWWGILKWRERENENEGAERLNGVLIEFKVVVMVMVMVVVVLLNTHTLLKASISSLTKHSVQFNWRKSVCVCFCSWLMSPRKRKRRQ